MALSLILVFRPVSPFPGQSHAAGRRGSPTLFTDLDTGHHTSLTLQSKKISLIFLLLTGHPPHVIGLTNTEQQATVQPQHYATHPSSHRCVLGYSRLHAIPIRAGTLPCCPNHHCRGARLRIQAYKAESLHHPEHERHTPTARPFTWCQPRPLPLSICQPSPAQTCSRPAQTTIHTQ